LGIGHISWVLAQRPSLGVMLNPQGSSVAGTLVLGSALEQLQGSESRLDSVSQGLSASSSEFGSRRYASFHSPLH